MKNRIISVMIVVAAAVVFSQAQTTEVKISLSEQFFEALLEAVFTHLDEPSVPINGFSAFGGDANTESMNGVRFNNAAFQVSARSHLRAPEKGRNSGIDCEQSIRLQREIDGVKTAVRFRQGKIYVAIAFKGDYRAPLIGCIDFQGWADTNIDLSYDQGKQALVGRANVLKVNLSGTNGVASGLLARFVQGSIDRKINPIEIIKLDRLSFVTPIQDAGTLRMRAMNVRHKVNDRSLDVFISYEFSKAD